MRRGPYKRDRDLTRLGERFELQGFFPPAKMADIAKDRTWGMVHAWIYTGMQFKHLQTMANSCYMQGINDAADSMIRAGWKPPENV
jgi:hypothetical protein